MKKLFILLGVICISGLAYAQWDTAEPIGRGTRIETKVVSVTTYTAVAVVSAQPYRYDCTIYNPSATYTLYIGSDGVKATHGYPIPPKTERSVDGLYTGAIYGTYEAGGATGDVNVMEAYKP